MRLRLSGSAMRCPGPVGADKYDARFLESRVAALLRPHDLWN